jgi:hypothetical protein
VATNSPKLPNALQVSIHQAIQFAPNTSRNRLEKFGIVPFGTPLPERNLRRPSPLIDPGRVASILPMPVTKLLRLLVPRVGGDSRRYCSTLQRQIRNLSMPKSQDRIRPPDTLMDDRTRGSPLSTPPRSWGVTLIGTRNATAIACRDRDSGFANRRGLR